MDLSLSEDWKVVGVKDELNFVVSEVFENALES
jgi:hypothetical protein